MIKIYHAKELGNNEKPYECVAQVDTDSIQEAYHSTQNIDDNWCTWDNKRSTSSGDVLIKDDDTAYFLVPMGNGRHGDKLYENWGQTEVIDNFNVNGFEYQGEIKTFISKNEIHEKVFDRYIKTY